MTNGGAAHSPRAGFVVRARQQASSAVLEGVDRAIKTRWEPAKDRAARLTGETRAIKVAGLTEIYARELGMVGAAVGGAAAVPAVGAAAVLAGAATELGWFTFRSSELVLTIGALHGHTDVTIEEQRAWILTVLVFGGSASEAFTKIASEVGKGLGKKAVQRIPASTLKAVNRSIGRTVVTKYGTKRGVITIGKALPFGIGAAIGGGMNYGSVRMIGKHADKFFTNLPYETVVEDDVDGPSAWRPHGTPEVPGGM